jgi:hypothetical protein
MIRRSWVVVVCLVLWGALACDGGGGGGGGEDTAPALDTMEEVAPDTHDVASVDVPGDLAPDVADAVVPQDTAPETVEEIVEEVTDAVDPDVVQPCATHVECDDGDPCTGDFCEAGVCTHQIKDCSDANACTLDLCSPETGQCAYELVDCDDGNECTLDSCKPATGCETIELADCCPADVVAAWDFEGEVPGLEITNLAAGGSPDVTWSLSSQRAYTGASSLYFGDLGTLTYSSGHRVRGMALLPPVTVPVGFDAELRVMVWPDIEDATDWDTFTVYAVVGDQRVPVLVKTLQTKYEEWNEMTVLLNPFAGQTVRIGLHFDSVDGGDNTGEGIYVDDLRLAARCPIPEQCLAWVDCSDKNVCTADTCQGGACAYDVDWECCLSETHCDDDDVCTIDLCGDDASCIHYAVEPPFCCYTDADCDDANICTDDDCLDGACFHKPSTADGCCEADIDCDDSSSCTIDTCEESGCVYVNTCCYSDDECDDFDDICTNDSCVAGACVYEATGVEGCCIPTFFQDDFSEDLGWVYDQNWERGPAQAGSGSTYNNDPGDDHSSSEDNYIAGVNIGGNAPTSIGGYYFITSPVIDLSSAQTPHLSFWRFLNSDYTPYMHNKVEVYNGSAWVIVWQTGSSPGWQDAAWAFSDHDVTAYKNANFKVRIGYNIGSGGVFSISSWNVDDVTVYDAGPIAVSPMCCVQDSDCQGIYAGAAACGGGQCTAP